MSEERDTKTIAGKFAEALGCLENSLYWLGQVNAEYDPERYADDRRSRFCNPALDFWLQTENAEGSLKDLLRKLQRVEPLALKEEEA